MKKIVNTILGIFQAEGSLSSKRVMGVAAWICVLVSYCHCATHGTQLPLATDMIVGMASTMLGIDSVTKIFAKKGDTDK